MTLSRGVSRKLFKTVTAENQDILQNIEFILLKNYRNNKMIDDKLCGEALRVLLYEKNCDLSLVYNIVEELRQIREIRNDISEKVWRDSLRIVLDSIRTHSSMKPDERNYLHFISHFF